MADSLDFSGVSDRREFTSGNYAGSGAITHAVICKPTGVLLDTQYHWIFNFQDLTDGAFGIVNAQLEGYDGTNESVSTGITIPALDEWYLIAMTKAAGTVTPRFHIYRYSTQAWIHANGSATLTNFPAAGDIELPHSGGEEFDGNLLIAGLWDSALSDGTLETLPNYLSAWVAAAPDEAWRFDTTGTIVPFVGKSVQGFSSGGTLDTGDAPNRWTDQLYTILAEDLFNRADGAIGADWTEINISTFNIASNVVRPSDYASDATAYFDTVSLPNDQWAEITCTELSGTNAGTGVGVILRCDGTNQNYYRVAAMDGTFESVEVAKFVGGTYTPLLKVTQDFSWMDTLGMSIQGSTLRVYRNGKQFGNSVVDASLATGRFAGISYSSVSATAKLDNFRAGSIDPTNEITRLHGIPREVNQHAPFLRRPWLS